LSVRIQHVWYLDQRERRLDLGVVVVAEGVDALVDVVRIGSHIADVRTRDGEEIKEEVRPEVKKLNDQEELAFVDDLLNESYMHT
jgi:hypothetical protein